MARFDAHPRELLLGLPLVTLGLAASSLLVLLVVQLLYASRLERAEDALRDAVHHFVRHPMLAIDPRLLPVLRDGMPGYDGNEAFKFLASKRSAPEQAELDALVQAGFGSLDAHPQRRLGLVPRAPAWSALLTHPLIHAGFFHWLASLGPLLLVGPVLEQLWGRRLYGGALTALALASAAAFSAIHSGLDRPLLGTSALASGLVAAALVRLRLREVEVLAWAAPFAPGLARRIPSAWLGGIGLGGALLGALALRGSLPPSLCAAPAPTAHAVAVALGALLAFGLERSGLEARFGKPLDAAPVRRASGGRFDLERVRRARENGDLATAFALLRDEAQRSVRHRDAVVAFFDVARELGRAAEATPALEKLVSEELRRGARDAAVSHWRRLAEHAPESRLEAAVLVRLAPRIRELAGPQAERLALSQALDDASLAGPLAAEIARRLAGLDPDLARAAAQRARERGGLGEAEQRALAPVAAGSVPDEEPLRPSPPAELPRNAFYEEQDRSAFGSVCDLAELDAPAGDGEPAAEASECAGEAPPQAEPVAPAPSSAPAAPSLFPGVRARAAVPVALEADALVIELPARERARLELGRVRAVALAGVRGLAPRAVVLVDLLLAGPEPGPERLALVRLRSDQFDPRRLVPEAGSPLDALLALAEELAKRARCPRLPAPDASSNARVPTYESLERYTREVLRAEPEPSH